MAKLDDMEITVKMNWLMFIGQCLIAMMAGALGGAVFFAFYWTVMQ